MADDEDYPQPIGIWGFASGWREPDEAQIEIQEKAWAGIFLGGAPYQRFFYRLRILFARFRLFCAYLVLAVACGLLVFGSLRAAEEGFARSLLLELASGLSIFLVAPLILAASRRVRAPVYAAIALGMIITGFLSYRSSGLAQAYLLEACVGLALLIWLDLAFKAVEDRARGAVHRALAEAHDFEVRVDEAEDAVAPQFFALGGGMIEETIQIDEMSRYLDICNQLSSDAPCVDPGMLGTIEAANRLKQQDPGEFLRRKGWALELRAGASPNDPTGAAAQS